MRYVLILFCLICPLYSVIAQELTSSNLPIIIIDPHGRDISDEPKITADMGIIDNGPGQRNSITDPFNGYNGKIGIEMRGSSSQSFPKKPYGVELRDDTGNGISASILGMPAEEDWAFIATYNDKSLMRDALAYKLGRDLGRYAPRTRFCELIIKVRLIEGGQTVVRNDYRGIYMVAEKIKRDDNRVDISKLEPSETSGDDLTGGYILKVDKFTGNGGDGFVSLVPPPNRRGNQQVYFQYDYPEYDKINSAQRTYIQQYVRRFETVLNSSTFGDEVNGYAKYIDVDSFIDFLILNELSKNVDGYRLSTYLFKDKDSKGGKLTMGPVWDFNLAFGNADYCDGGPVSGWMYNFNITCGDDSWLIPFWWKRLLADPSFSQKLGARWDELRADKLSDASINHYIDSVASVLDDEATQRNFTMWPVLGVKIWPNVYVGPTFQSEVNWLKDWISDRASWLDNNMPDVITATEETHEAPFQLTVFPNPFVNELSLKYSVTKPCVVTLELYDVLGHRVYDAKQSPVKPGSHEVILDKLTISEGIYYLKGTTTLDTKPVVRKVIRQR